MVIRSFIPLALHGGFVSLALNSIHRGDCLELLAQVPEGSVDLAFADPPFNIGYEYDVYEDRQAAEDYLSWCGRWMQALHRVLKPDGTFWLAIGDEFAAELKIAAQREVGFTCRSWVIWYYTFGVNCKYKFSRSHAHLFHFVKDAKKFTFNVDQIRVPSARQLVYGDSRANAAGRLPDDTWLIPPREQRALFDGELDREETSRGNDYSRVNGEQNTSAAAPQTFTLRPQDLPRSFQPEDDTWYFPRVAGTFKQRAGWHGCQMPEQLLGRIVRACSNPGELVLDPFGGSGTTLAVAKKLGRNFLGCELSPEYAANIEKRLAAIASGDPLDGAAEPLASAPATSAGISLVERELNKKRYQRKKATAK